MTRREEIKRCTRRVKRGRERKTELRVWRQTRDGREMKNRGEKAKLIERGRRGRYSKRKRVRSEKELKEVMGG